MIRPFARPLREPLGLRPISLRANIRKNLLQVWSRANRQASVNLRNVCRTSARRIIHHVYGVALLEKEICPAWPPGGSLQPVCASLPRAVENYDRIWMTDFFRNHHLNVFGAIHDFLARRTDILPARIKKAGAGNVLGRECGDRRGRNSQGDILGLGTKRGSKEDGYRRGLPSIRYFYFHGIIPLICTLRYFDFPFRAVPVYSTFTWPRVAGGTALRFLNSISRRLT